MWIRNFKRQNNPDTHTHAHTHTYHIISHTHTYIYIYICRYLFFKEHSHPVLRAHDSGSIPPIPPMHETCPLGVEWQLLKALVDRDLPSRCQNRWSHHCHNSSGSGMAFWSLFRRLRLSKQTWLWEMHHRRWALNCPPSQVNNETLVYYCTRLVEMLKEILQFPTI